MIGKRYPLLRRILASALVIASFGLIWITVKTPRHDRNWAEDVARLPDAAVQADGTILITDIREWDYDRSGPTNRQWTDRSYDPSRLVGLWFNLDPFPAWDGVAHTFLVFEFAEGTPQRFLGVSVEARKQRGQTYSGLNGLFRQYELLYVWASESDLLKRRGLYLGEDVYQYRLDLTPDQIRFVFQAFLDRTRKLADEPRFYNTLLSNCTNELAKTVRRSGGRIPWHYSFYLTGYSDRYLHKLGFIGASDQAFSRIREAAHRNSAVRDHAGKRGMEFSDAIRRLR